MTNEEAIQEIHDWIEREGRGEISIVSLSLAIDALRERIEREKGCEYCDFVDNIEGAWGDFKIGRKILRCVTGYATTVTTALSSKGLMTLYYNEESGRKSLRIERINFCPMCGRELKEE